jgi:ferredoxin
MPLPRSVHRALVMDTLVVWLDMDQGGPLGAPLALQDSHCFPAPLRIFDWLRRRKACGRPCQICAVQCEVQAIRPTGEINPNECQHCLDCQITYWDDTSVLRCR